MPVLAIVPERGARPERAPTSAANLKGAESAKPQMEPVAGPQDPTMSRKEVPAIELISA